jgi:hypothetical protein
VQLILKGLDTTVSVFNASVQLVLFLAANCFNLSLREHATLSLGDLLLLLFLLGTYNGNHNPVTINGAIHISYLCVVGLLLTIVK